MFKAAAMGIDQQTCVALRYWNLRVAKELADNRQHNVAQVRCRPVYHPELVWPGTSE